MVLCRVLLFCFSGLLIWTFSFLDGAIPYILALWCDPDTFMRSRSVSHLFLLRSIDVLVHSFLIEVLLFCFIGHFAGHCTTFIWENVNSNTDRQTNKICIPLCKDSHFTLFRFVGEGQGYFSTTSWEILPHLLPNHVWWYSRTKRYFHKPVSYRNFT